MSGSRPYEIVFLHLNVNSEMAADTISKTFHALDGVVGKLEKNKEFTICRSPHGAAVLCRHTQDALETALRALRALGSAVTVGLDLGYVCKVRGIDGQAAVGLNLNMAARRAFLKGRRGCAIASFGFVEAAKALREPLKRGFFGRVVKGRVKTTNLEYHVIKNPEYVHDVQKSFKSKDLKFERMPVFVFDIAGFTNLPEPEMTEQVEHLGKIVQQAFTGLGLGHKLRRRAYIPAGDGGALVFPNEDGELAVVIAREIRELAERANLRLHCGLDFGQMAFRDKLPPIGPAVFGADDAAQESEEWKLCVTDRFLDNIPERLREELTTDAAVKVLTTVKPHVAGDRGDDDESGQLWILDGATWTKWYDAIINLDESRPFVSEHPKVYLHAVESATTAAVLSSGLGYDQAIHALADERHPVRQLISSGAFDGRIVRISPEKQFDVATAEKEHLKELRRDLSLLSLSGEAGEHYRELVLRDAHHFLLQEDGSPHPSLLEANLSICEYVFRKDYTKNEGLCKSVNAAFVHELEKSLKLRYERKTTRRSREAFVRRLMVAHLAIGFNYQQAMKIVEPAKIEVVGSTQHILATPTRSRLPLLMAANQGEVRKDVSKYVTPLCLHEFLVHLGRGAKPMEALAETRNSDWARLTRRALRNGDIEMERGVLKVATDLMAEFERKLKWRAGQVGELFSIQTDPKLSPLNRQLLLALHQAKSYKDTQEAFLRHFLRQG